MDVIPVVDILGGNVVRAVRGERSAYRPIRSALCDSSEPLRVARILVERCATRKLYVADLDALLGGDAQTRVIAALLASIPELEVWLDAGFDGLAASRNVLGALEPYASRVTPVFGSESLRSHEEAVRCFAHREAAILSLDRRDGRPLDPGGCWTADAFWPSRIIVMTLDRVGAFAGPDLDTIADVRYRAPHAEVIGAGGIRDADDLEAAARTGAHAWLVASALHDLRIPANATGAHRLSAPRNDDAMALREPPPVPPKEPR
jgi:phosphoribosylformimino-5-aminoimidazole carboxamide ribotide isomerase